MSGAADSRPRTEEQAGEALIQRWLKAIDCFRATDLPQWKRTQNAMLCFKGLPLEHMPHRLQRRIDACFSGINDVLTGYDIQTWEDYAQVSPEDLTRIEKLIENLPPVRPKAAASLRAGQTA